MQRGTLAEVHVFWSSLSCLDLASYLKHSRCMCKQVRIKLEALVELPGLAA